MVLRVELVGDHFENYNLNWREIRNKKRPISYLQTTLSWFLETAWQTSHFILHYIHVLWYVVIVYVKFK